MTLTPSLDGVVVETDTNGGTGIEETFDPQSDNKDELDEDIYL